MSQNRFNIRVYGILINENNEVLISDECRGGVFFTKFPGGGLEWGEGLKDCLIREFQEELCIDVEIEDLFYCTDFFVESAFRKTDQLISIYFNVNYSRINELNFEKYEIPLTVDTEKFRWLPLEQISEEVFTFPIDKLVAERLKK
jgi:8-oxo-dGTP diphosphatase